jgi:hypothetical protein
MYSLETTLFSLLLLAGSILLVRWHWVVWQRAAREDMEPAHRKFLHDQCRRRVQASGMIGLIGVAMFVGQFLDRWPLVKLFHWSGVLLLVVWAILLAGADLVVSRQYLGRLHRDQVLEAMRSVAEFNRRQEKEPTSENDLPDGSSSGD